MKIITFNKDGLEMPIRFELEKKTIWMTQNEMATLFSTSQPNISKRIKLLGDFLKENASTHNSELYVAKDGKTRKMSIYNLDVVRLIGFKIDPVFTNNFISWCNEQLGTTDNQIMSIQSNIIRFDNGDVEIEVEVEPREQTVWMTQKQIALLFDTTQPNISQHITNIINEDELADDSVHKESLYTALDGKDLNESHDHYLIIDNSIYYNLGPSLNYIGYKIGNINRMNKKEDIATLLEYVSRFIII